MVKEEKGPETMKAAGMERTERDREQDLLALLENTSLSIWSVDRDYNLIFGNASFQRRSNLIIKRSIAPGETVLPLDWGMDHVERWQGYYNRVFKGESFRVLLRRDDIESYLYMDYSFSPIYDSDGEITGATVVGRDATEYIQRAKAVKRQHEAIVKLATSPSFISGDVPATARLLTEGVAKALQVSRVSVWLLEANDETLVCKDLYSLINKTHESGASLATREYPEYFDALKKERVVNVYDVSKDPRTTDLCIPYFIPHDISSMLDATIRLQGKVRGVICLEHEGVKRSWNPEETDFAAQLADQMAQLLAIFEHRQTGELYRAVVEDTPLLICCFLPSGELTFVNKTYAEYFKKTTDELIGFNFLDIIPPESRPGVVENLLSITVNNPTVKNDHEVLLPDGKTKWQRWTNRGIFDESGNILYFHSTGEDTTEQLGARRRLERSEARYRNVVSSVKAVVFEVGLNGEWLFLNESWSVVTGYSVEESLGRNFLEFVYPDDRAKNIALFKPLVQGKKEVCRHEVRYLHKDGGYRWIDAHAVISNSEDGQPKVVIGTLTDITQRKVATSALNESQRKLSTLISNVPGMVYRCINDSNWTMEFVSEGCVSLTGYEPSELKHNKVVAYADIIHPDDRSMVWAEVQEELDKKNAFELIYRIRDRSNEIKWVWEQGRGVFNAQGDLLALEGYITDITTRKLARESLELLQEQLHAVLDAVPSYIFAKNYEGRFIMVNRALAEFFGSSPEEVVGKTDADYVATEVQIAKYLDADRKVMDTGLPLFIAEEEILLKDGSIGIFQTTKVPYSHPGVDGKAILGVSTDITARRQAEEERARFEEQLRHVQRMEAIGQLTGGIAHDFNNLLQAMNGYTELALLNMDDTHPARESLIRATKAGERGANLLSQLLHFARQQIMHPASIDLNEVISDNTKLLERVIGEHILIEWTPGAHLDKIYADATMVGQVLINLCLNARDAMPNGGRLIIETNMVEVDENYCTTHSWADTGRYALLTVRDTGTGIEKENLGRIFEPFFTTKEVDRGTGLGLATVYGIVKQHRGMINVYSESGAGTVFKVYWPIAKTTPAKASDPSPKAKSDTSGNETILLAEDDESVRQLTTLILESAGYTVLSAHDGHEATSLFDKHHDQIDLLLLDVIMPKIGGHTAWEKMKERAPHIKAIFVSGYSEDSIHSDYILNDGVSLIQKPFSRNDLLSAVRAALDQV